MYVTLLTEMDVVARKTDSLIIERTQLGVRMEKRLVKVLKGLAEYHDRSLGDLLEGIVLQAFENTPPFTEGTLRRIAQLKEVYGLDYGAEASHRFRDEEGHP